MSELDEAWAVALAEAEARSRASGRTDISKYLALRRSNDLIRKIGSDWLLTLFATVAGEANRTGAAIQISKEAGYRFKVGNAHMVGSLLSLESGVRRVSVEVGWPRTPRDGFIRGGGLACGTIKHFGMKSVSEQLRLVLDSAGSPRWIAVGKHDHHQEIREADVRNHVAMLLKDSRNSNLPS